MTRLRLGGGVLAAIAADTRARMPREACGLLIGRRESDGVVALRAWPAANRALAGILDRFELDLADFLAALAAAEEAEQAVIGVYHSHPTGPLALSHADRAAAWPDLVQLIAVPEGPGISIAAWHRARSADPFEKLRCEHAGPA